MKIIVYIAQSLDGYIADKTGSVAWLDKFQSKDEDYGYTKFIKSITTVVMGRTTYEQILSFGEYPYKEKKSFVFSSTLKSAGNTDVVSGSVQEFIDKKIFANTDILWIVGGANLIKQFLEAGLIDEIQLFTMPILLGSGIRLFTEHSTTQNFKLKDHTAYDSGVVETIYTKIK